MQGTMCNIALEIATINARKNLPVGHQTEDYPVTVCLIKTFKNTKERQSKKDTSSEEMHNHNDRQNYRQDRFENQPRCQSYLTCSVHGG